MQQKFGHGGVIIHRAGLIDLAIQTFQRRRVVVLHINEGEDVADGIGDGQIRAELAAIAGVAGGNLRAFRHQADHEAGAEMVAQLAQAGDEIHDGWRGGMLEVRVSRGDG